MPDPALQDMTSATPPAQSDAQASISEVVAAFHVVRAAISELFTAIGADPTKTRESATKLGLNRGLAWRLSRVVRAANPSGVVSDVPGPQSMAKFLDVCRERGAPEVKLRRAAEAIDAFEVAVSSCSGDRKTLAMLMSNQSGGAPASEVERSRRTLCEGASAVWGVQAQVRFVTVFLYPTPGNSLTLDAAHVTGFVGFRRLCERSWPLSYEAVHKADGSVQRFSKQPLDPEGVGEGELQLLKEFCEPRRPKINVVESEDYKRFELAPGPVGNQGLTTCVFGSLLSGISQRYSSDGDTSGFMVLLQTPIERVVFDMFLHRDIEVSDIPRVQLLDRLTYPYVNRESEFDKQLLPITEAPAPLPGGIAGALCPHMPFYPRLLEFVCGRTGVGFESFRGSRFEMAYPPIATILSRRFLLPLPPR